MSPKLQLAVTDRVAIFLQPSILVILVLAVGCRTENTNFGKESSATANGSGTGELFLPPAFVDNNPVVEAAIPFVNATGRPTRVARIVKSCSCTEAIVDRQLAGPGETITAKATFNLLGRFGVNRFLIGLETERGDKWTREVVVEAIRRAAWDKDHLYLGTISADEPIRDPAVFTEYHRRKEDAIEVTEFSSASQTLVIERIECNTNYRADIDHFGTTHKVFFRIKNDGQTAATSAFINVRGAGATGRNNLAVSWRLRQVFEVAPSSLFLVANPAGENVRVLVSRADRASFVLSSVSSDHAELLKAELRPSAERNSYLIEVRHAIPAEHPTLSGQLTIRTDDSKSPVLRIPYAFFGANAPQ
jgi:hypothetical protein